MRSNSNLTLRAKAWSENVASKAGSSCSGCLTITRTESAWRCNSQLANAGSSENSTVSCVECRSRRAVAAAKSRRQSFGTSETVSVKASGGSPKVTSIHPCLGSERWKIFMGVWSGLTSIGLNAGLAWIGEAWSIPVHVRVIQAPRPGGSKVFVWSISPAHRDGHSA